MGKFKNKKKTKSLRPRLDDDDDDDQQQSSHGGDQHWVKTVRRPSRKVMRKQARLLKKAKRNVSGSKRPLIVPNLDQKKTEEIPPATPAVSKTKTKDLSKKGFNEPSRDKYFLEKHIRDCERMRLKRNREMYKEDNILEEKSIKELEKKMGIVPEKKYIPKSIIEDGLNYLLDVCDSSKITNMFDPKSLDDDNSDFEDDFLMAIGKKSGAAPISKSAKIRVLPVSNKVSDRKRLTLTTTETEPNSDSANKQLASNLDNSEVAEMDEATSDHDIYEDPESNDGDYEEDDDDEDMDDDDDDDEEEEGGRAHDHEDIDDCNDEQSIEDKKSEKQKANESEEEKSAEVSEEEKQEPPNKKCRNSIGAGPKEDIYGRLIGEDGKVIEPESSGDKRYIPPSIRAKMLGDGQDKTNESLIRLRRQLKGLLNRLSESNLSSISNQIAELFMCNARNDMNESLVDLIFEAVIQTSLTPERLAQEHALLITVLHANVGTEVGAHFLESTARRLDSLINSGDSNYGVGKQCDNALMLLIHLYIFGITNSSLVYEVLNILSNHFREKDLDLILLILRTAGFTLRKDDPIALKEIICTLQAKANTATLKNSESRVKFMLETIVAIKNNNVRKIPNYDPTHIKNLCKALKSNIHKGKSATRLTISWADLISAELKGRWWVVGSAWKDKDASVDDATKIDGMQSSHVPVENVSQELMAFARNQRMSTDDRKNIFCILMTAHDYVDAFEKLMRLGLKSTQERNIILVVLDCCLQERTFNCFYAFLMIRFSNTHRKYKMMIQCAIWDRIKTLETSTPLQLSNFAHLLSRLFLSNALSLSTLKVIEFADMNKTIVSFLRQIMLELCLHEPAAEADDAFTRLGSSPKNHTTCESLRIFVELFMMKNKNKAKNLEPEVAMKLESRIDNVRKILSKCETSVRM